MYTGCGPTQQATTLLRAEQLKREAHLKVLKHRENNTLTQACTISECQVTMMPLIFMLVLRIVLYYITSSE
jgi:hypothetical protein